MSEKRVIVWVQHFGDRPHLVLQWHDPVTGQRKSKSAGTCNPLDAEKARADLEYELNHGLHQQGSSMSWERFREVFEAEHVAPLRRNTRIGYAATLDAFERLCNPSRLDLVTARTVSAFATGLRTYSSGKAKGGLKASSIQVRLLFLHTALAWAADQGLLAKVPKFPTVKVPARKPQPVPAESFERLLAKAPDDNMRAYLLCGWLAGLRLDEAFRLGWEPAEDAPHVDLAADRIVLPAEFAKADRDQWVPLDPMLREALLALPRRGRRVFLFTARAGRPVGVKAVCHRVIRLAKRAGVKLSMHTLRKGFGCRYAGRVPAQVLQKLMRHSNIKTTMDYYANVDDAVMEAVLGPKRNTPRNSGAPAQQAPETTKDATPDSGGASSATSASR
jgi:integrase